MAKQVQVTTETFDAVVKKDAGPSTGAALVALALGSSAVWAGVAWVVYTLIARS